MTLTTRESKETDSSHPAKEKKNTGQGQWSVAQDRNWNTTAEVMLQGRRCFTATAPCIIEMLAAMHQTIRGHYFEVIHSQHFSSHSFTKPDDAQVTNVHENTEFHHCYMFRHVCAILRKFIHHI